MITPGFSPTATERVLPKLALDFTTASLDSRVTFTRTTDATHPATYVNSGGYVTAATNNQPRFDYDPVALTCKGLLIEESRTNVLKYSSDYTNAAWGNADVTVTPTAITAPDNTLTGSLLADNTNSAEHLVYQTITATTNQAYTYTVYAKAGTANQFRIRIDSTGASSATSLAVFTQTAGVFSVNTFTGLITSASATNVGNSWYRCQLTYTLNGTVTSHLLRIYPYLTGVYVGTGSGTYFWGSQHEAGAFATSYIPTTTTALTRNADVATMTGTNFSSWFNATQGSFFTQSDTYYPAATAGVVLIASDGTANERIQVSFGSNSLSVAVTDGGVSQVSGLTATASSANTFYDMVVGYKENNCGFAVNAGTPTTDTTCTMPTVDQLWIGRRTTYLNGHVAKLMYWPQKLTTAEIQAFSK